MHFRPRAHPLPTRVSLAGIRLLEFFFPPKTRSDFSPASVTFGREHFPAIVGEIGALLALCRDDLPRAVDGAPFDLDVGAYHRLHEAGVSRIYVCRVSGELVGFMFFSILRHPHYRGRLWASSDMLLLHPAWRAIGWATRPYGWWRRLLGIDEKAGLDACLVHHAEKQLRDEGVEVIQASTGAALPARTLRHLGYGRSEWCSFVKHLRR